MNHEQILRAVLIVVLLMVLPFGIYYRLKSPTTREKLARRQEGLFILATLRPMGARVFDEFCEQTAVVTTLTR